MVPDAAPVAEGSRIGQKASALLARIVAGASPLPMTHRPGNHRLPRNLEWAEKT
jgi:hypothetical protein